MNEIFNPDQTNQLPNPFELESAYLRSPISPSKQEIELCRSWLSRHPDYLKPIYARARILANAGKHLAARDVLLHTLRTCRQDFGALWTATHLAKLLFQNNKSAQLSWVLDFAEQLKDDIDPVKHSSPGAMLDAIAALANLRAGRTDSETAQLAIRTSLSRIRDHDHDNAELHSLQILHLILSTPEMRNYPAMVQANDYRLIDYVAQVAAMPPAAQHLFLACLQVRLSHPCQPSSSFLKSLFLHIEKTPIWPAIDWSPRSLGHACSLVLWAVANPQAAPQATTQFRQPFIRVTAKVYQAKNMLVNYELLETKQIQEKTEFHIYKGLSLGPNIQPFYEARSTLLNDLILSLKSEIYPDRTHALVPLKSLLLANAFSIDTYPYIEEASTEIRQFLDSIKSSNFRLWTEVLHNYAHYQHRTGSGDLDALILELVEHKEFKKTDPSILGRLSRICLDKALFPLALTLKITELQSFKQSIDSSSELAAHTLFIGYAMTNQFEQAATQLLRIQQPHHQPYLIEAITRLLSYPGQSDEVREHAAKLLEFLPAQGRFGDLRLKDKGPEVVEEVLKKLKNDENRFLLHPKYWLSQSELDLAVQAFSELFSQTHAKTQFILNMVSDTARTLDNPLKAEVLRRIIWQSLELVRLDPKKESISQIQNVLVRLRFHRLFFGNPPRRLTAVAGMKYIQGTLNDSKQPLPPNFEEVVSEVSALWHDLSDMDWTALKQVFSKSLTFNQSHPCLHTMPELRELFHFANESISQPRSPKKKAPKKGAFETSADKTTGN